MAGRIPLKSLPPVSLERVQELARRVVELDGRARERDGARERGPSPDGRGPLERARSRRTGGRHLKPDVRAVLDGLPTVEAKAGAFFLLDGDEVVYVGISQEGLLGKNVALHRKGRHPDIQAKVFDRASFQAVPDSLLDGAERAFVRLLRPKYNRNLYGGVLTDQDRELLMFLGYPVGRQAA